MRFKLFSHLCLAGALLLLSESGSPADSQLRQEARARRIAYLQRATEGVTLVFNRRHRGLNEYVPDKNFYYLTGCTEPGAVLLLIPGEDGPREILFLAGRGPETGALDRTPYGLRPRDGPPPGYAGSPESGPVAGRLGSTSPSQGQGLRQPSDRPPTGRPPTSAAPNPGFACAAGCPRRKSWIPVPIWLSFA